MDEGYVQDFEEGEAHDNEENGHQYASRKYISSLKRAPFYLAAGLLVVAGVVLLISSQGKTRFPTLPQSKTPIVLIRTF